MTVLRNTGSGLEPWATASTRRDPAELAVSDVDGDGRPDVVTSDQGDGRLTVLRNTGAGLEPWARVPVERPTNVTTGDVDGDGRPDLVASSLHSGRVTVFGNTGDGRAFELWSTPVSAGSVQSAVLADLDGDGRLDVAADRVSSRVTVLRNATTPPPVVVDPPFVTFDPRQVGTTSETRTVTLRNTGDRPFPMHWTRHTDDTVGTRNFGPLGGTCRAHPVEPTVLAPGASCTFEVDFRPASSGEKLAAVQLYPYETAVPLTVVLRGLGTPIPGGTEVPPPPVLVPPIDPDSEFAWAGAVPDLAYAPSSGDGQGPGGGAGPGDGGPAPGSGGAGDGGSGPAGATGGGAATSEPSPGGTPVTDAAVPAPPVRTPLPRTPLRLRPLGASKPTMTRNGAVRVAVGSPVAAGGTCRVILRVIARLRGRTVVVGRRTVVVRRGRTTVAQGPPGGKPLPRAEPG